MSEVDGGDPPNASSELDAEMEEAPTVISSDSLLSLLNDSTFSDVTIYAGAEKTPFQLHRAIICLKSDFFKAACKPNFQEGLSREINLPEIEPETFEKIARYIYGEEYVFDTFDCKHTDLVRVFEAADFLGIRALKASILEQFGSLISKKDGREYQEKTLRGVTTLFRNLARHFQVSNWAELEKIADVMVLRRSTTTSGMKNVAGEAVGSSYLRFVSGGFDGKVVYAL
ncbi:hypothetical protein ABW19_dt0203920 [Dactylella cylindrospora]|nr:hypothetical protein ABW19_dt0203920 [Dactylella cylindrospora]